MARSPQSTGAAAGERSGPLRSIAEARDFGAYSSAVQRALAQENEYRRVLANPAEAPESPCLHDGYAQLCSLSEAALWLRYRAPFAEERSVPRVFPLESRERAGDPCVCSLDEFRENFEVLTEGMLRGVDWSNAIVAGGAVASCLKRVPSQYRASRKELRRYFHDEACSGVDVDLFLYGLDESTAKRKLLSIAESIEGQVIYPIKYFRTTHSITLVSRYPYVNVQIILRLYQSPAEVVMGFDIDSCAVLFDGKDVFFLPRSFNAYISQCNTVDMTRRSPTYESRLAKYAARGFEVLVPTLDRAKVDPVIYEKSFSQTQGLARLLLLEKFKDPEERIRYIIQRDLSKGKGLTKNVSQMLKTTHMRSTLLDMGDRISDYSNVFFPWGPEWTGERTAKLLREKDTLLNSEFFTGESKEYHVHPCVISDTMAGVFESGCDDCPEFPDDQQEELSEKYVRGPIEFLKDNPGRQMIGSFHPITEGDWSEGTYISEHAAEFIALCQRGSPAEMKRFLDENKVSVNTCDSLNRSPLHLLMYGKNQEMLSLLLREGADVCARMQDGRTAFHLAAIYNNVDALERLLERNASLPEEERCSLVSVESGYGLSALDLATLFLHDRCVSLLLDAGCEATSVLSKKSRAPQLPSILLSGFQSVGNLVRVKKIVQSYFSHGLSSFQVFQDNRSMPTIFQWSVANGFVVLARAIYESDPKCAEQVKYLFDGRMLVTYGMHQKNALLFKTLIDWGAQMIPSQESCDLTSKWLNRLPKHNRYSRKDNPSDVQNPMEALVHNLSKAKQVDLAIEMIEYAKERTELDFRASLGTPKRTVLDFVKQTIKHLEAAPSPGASEDKFKPFCFQSMTLAASRCGYMCVGERALVPFNSEYLQSLKSEPAGSYGRAIYDHVQRCSSAKDPVASESETAAARKDRERRDVLVVALKRLAELLVRYGVPSGRSLSNASGSCSMTCSNNYQASGTGFVIMGDQSNDQCSYNRQSTAIPKSEEPKYRAFYNAVWVNDVEMVKRLADPDQEDPVLVASRCPLGINPLLLALHRGNEELVPVLIEYTPPKTVKVVDSRRINNLAILSRSMPSTLVENVIDTSVDFSKLKSLTDPAFLLRDVCDIGFVDRVLHAEDGQKRSRNFSYASSSSSEVDASSVNTAAHPFLLSAFSYALWHRKAALLESLFDALSAIDEARVAKTGRALRPEEGSLVGLLCASGQGSLARGLFQSGIRAGGVDVLRVLVRRAGCCYVLPEPSEAHMSAPCFMWYASMHARREVLEYLLSPLVREDLEAFQAGSNPFKEEWSSRGVLPLLLEQFSATFAKSVSAGPGAAPARCGGARPRCPMVYAAMHNNLEALECLVAAQGPSVNERQLQQALELGSHPEREALMMFLLRNGARLTPAALYRFISRLDGLPNPYSEGSEGHAAYAGRIREGLAVLERILGSRSPEDKASLWSAEDTRCMYQMFRKHLVAGIDLLLRHGYSFEIVSKQFQNIVHVTALNVEWYSEVKHYLASVMGRPEIKALLHQEDGFGEIPFETYLNSYLKSVIGTATSFGSMPGSKIDAESSYLRSLLYLPPFSPAPLWAS